MADITIDMTGDQNGEPDPPSAAVKMDQHGLSDYSIQIAGLHLLLNYEQLEGLYNALRPWFEEEAD